MITVDAKPFAYSFPEDKVALIVIDMQRDFIEPGGFGETLGNNVALLQAILPGVAGLLKVFRDNGWPVIHTREGHKPDLSDCPPAKRLRGNPSLRIGDDGPMGRILIHGSPGHDIVAECAAIEGEYVVDKPGKGAFYATELGEILKKHGITHLIFAGVTTEVCVQTTMREANDRGYENLLIEDATESYFPEFKAAAMEMIRAQGAIVGWTAPLASLEDAVAKTESRIAESAG
ncbi:Peroxyureidoacrylate/ureidoacrylate amidohydrolase RutB [Hartmannibacter diazotrophicus]|uniref:Peroxyureidoacrylate/ureidoacrylate amidohydrolase RutB n=1 Tax=Hartmannibacter diazotrophicus TaxID=1482074 RepID=A0A2C9DB13_9HYPH|nr:cysteine hydrolase [Hartmannibacter diazotrophicus]SON56931.1 Peroxyureidoacrylate/ureidoacrylate amidohydrolase RutB [Hartmannibacter diazotrophicus]